MSDVREQHRADHDQLHNAILTLREAAKLYCDVLEEYGYQEQVDEIEAAIRRVDHFLAAAESVKAAVRGGESNE